MEPAIILSSLVSLAASSAAIGYLYCEARARLTDRRNRIAIQTQLEVSLKTVLAEHNKLVGQMQDFGDRLGIVDMKASGVLGRKPPQSAAKPIGSQI